DLTGRTDLFQIAGLARRAAGAVGNDTGPMHLIAAVGCPSLVLFSHASDPAQSGQTGPRVRHLRVPALDQLPVDAVEQALGGLMAAE
ncbi:glycosyltransferase family 9 protein, partial [Acinetobacter baumannii]